MKQMKTKKRTDNNAAPNKSMDVRAKQRLCYQRCPLNFSGLGGGFAPRHLNRWAASHCNKGVK